MFDRMGDEYEELVVCHDRVTGLKAIVAIHSTVLGPALGGTRFYPYATEDEAVTDVMRLARGMTYKSAAAGLDLGGGKAVILGDPRTLRSEELLRVYGRFLDSLGGRYITAEDMGTTQADMDLIFRETPNVTGISESLGGSGDPSAATAYGVWWAMKAARQVLDGTTDLAGCHVVVSGAGKVGSGLIRYLVEEQATVTVADVDDAAVARAVETFGVAAAPVQVAHTLACDIYSPCAMGAVFNARTIPELRCRAAVGCANNQLATVDDGRRLAGREILYAPDFVVNAGGVINIAEELVGYDRERAYANVRGIFDTTQAVLIAGRDLGVTTTAVAEGMAEQRLAAAAAGGAARVRRFDGTATRARPSNP